MNHVLAQQKAEKRLLLLEVQEMIGTTALESICTLSGGEEKLSGTTMEKACPEIRKAQRTTHSVRTLATDLAGVLPAEHIHFMINSRERASAPSCDH